VESHVSKVEVFDIKPEVFKGNFYRENFSLR